MKLLKFVSLADNITFLQHYWLKLPQQKIAHAINVLLVVYLGYAVSQLIWLIVSPAPVATSPVTVSSVAQSNADGVNTNVTALQSLQLFGQYQAQASKPKPDISNEIIDAPVTRLNLLLTGVVASSETDSGAAIIANNGRQQTYGVGDEIEGTRAILHQVFSDRVIIKHQGKLETLMLDGFEYKKLSTLNSGLHEVSSDNGSNDQEEEISEEVHTAIDHRDNDELTEQAIELKQDILEDPSSISDYLAISPVYDGGNIKGYRLKPGKNSEFFEASGLKNGDVAVQLNGFDLTDPEQAAQALVALREQQQITLTIDRQGELTDILFSIAN
jgi:general secretion pathway protein C